MDNNMNNFENNGYQPPVEPNAYQQPQYNAPQYEQPQYNAPQYEQPQYGAPQYGQPMYAPITQKDDSKGMAIASLVCGILSVTCCCGGWLPSILAVIFGIISKNRKSENNGMALAGIILGAIGIVFSILLIIMMATGTFEDLMNEMYYY